LEAGIVGLDDNAVTDHDARDTRRPPLHKNSLESLWYYSYPERARLTMHPKYVKRRLYQKESHQQNHELAASRHH